MRISIVGKLYAAAAVALCAVIAIGIWWRPSRLPALMYPLDEDTRFFLSKTLFHVGGHPVRVLFLIKVFLFLVFLNLAARVARLALGLLVRNNPRFDRQREYVLSKFVTFAIYGVGILIGIRVEGINLTTLAIVGGTLGVGVGFGLQPLVSDFISGFILLVEEPIRIGDRIEFGDKIGEVVRVGSRSSSIRTSDNALLIVPNSDFITKQIVNWTASSPRIRITLPVSVAFGTNPKEVIGNLLELANSHADVMKDPIPVVLLSDVGPHALKFNLHVWTLNHAENFMQLRSDLYVSILKRFEEKNIETPFAQLDLHVKSIDAPVSISNIHEVAKSGDLRPATTSP